VSIATLPLAPRISPGAHEGSGVFPGPREFDGPRDPVGPLRARPSELVGPLRASGAPGPLRRLPLPVLEPEAAVPLVQLDAAVSPEQEQLDFGPGFGAGARAGWTRTGASERTPPHEDPSADDRAAQAWATRFVLAAVEVAVGSRPTGQLVRWTSPEVQDLLERRAALATRMRRRRSLTETSTARRRVRIRAVRCCPITPGIWEVSAVVQEHDRTRAVALRMEQLEGRWRATAFELG
jgi:hypothetical protein